MAIIALIAFSSCAVFFTDFSSAEEEEAVTEVKIGDGSGFKVGNVLYTVTNDTEYEEEAGIIGVVDTALPAVAVTSFVFGEDEIAYTVTSVVADFKNNCAEKTGIKLYLPDSVASLEAGCFEGISFANTIYVAEGCEGIDGTGAAAAPAVCPGTVKFTISFDKGDITYSQFKDQSMDDQEIPDGMTVAIAECEFENPYYALTEWTDASDNAYGDCASLTVVDSKLYVDGVETDIAIADMALTANWEAEGTDYPEYYHWITVGIIVVLAIIGLSSFAYRTIMARRG